MTHPTLFASPTSAPALADHVVVVADAADVLPTLHGASLVVADPPWVYNLDRPDRRGSPSNHYDCLTMAGIVRHLDLAYDAARDDSYLLCWSTWPTLAEFLDARAAMRWEYVSGACWTKWNADGTPSVPGIGYHWRGDSEPLLMLRKGRPKPSGTVRNAWVEPRTRTHSEKPVAWLAQIVAALTEPGDLVIELYGGTCPTARACKRTGRRSASIEIDVERAEWGRTLIAAERQAWPANGVLR